MPSSVFTGAVYGTGVYGTARYDSFGIVVSVDGVQGSFTLNDTLQIEADASHTICTLCLGVMPGQVGSVSITGESNTDLTGVEASVLLGTPGIDAATILFVEGLSANGAVNTSTVLGDAILDSTVIVSGSLNGAVGPLEVLGSAIVLSANAEATGYINTVNIAASSIYSVVGILANFSVGDLSLETNNYLDVLGVSGSGEIGAANVIASATVSVTGVFGTAFVDTVTILENEIVIPELPIAVLLTGAVVVNTVVFDFNAVSSQYSRNRTAYVPRRPTAKERTVIVPAGQ